MRCAILRGVQMEEFVSSTIINGNPYPDAHSLCIYVRVVGVVGSSGSLGDEVGDGMGGPGGFLVEIAEGQKNFGSSGTDWTKYRHTWRKRSKFGI